MTPGYTIQAEGVRKEFDGVPVLDGVDLRVPAGEITLLAGPNGGGKTVLLNCLAGGLAPTDGRVRVRGKPIADAAADVSLLTQGALSLPELSVRENVAFYSKLHPDATVDAEGLLAAFGLDAPEGKPLRHFSGGMVRKVELAIALSADVPVYLLDEPGAELDPSAVGTLHDVLLEKRATGRTVVITSHAPLDAAIADRLVVLAGGRVVANGSPDRLLADVPGVLRVRGPIRNAADRVSGSLVDGYAFERGDEARGFLREDVDIEEIAAALPDCLVDVDEPSYTDAFEYYTSVRPC